MTDPIQATLTRRFGFDGFKPGQREVVEHLLAGRSAAAVFPTGGGKSLCYQLPALMLPGITLVVSPLIALMKDQIDALAARGIAAARLDSTLDADAYREVMRNARSGAMRLLYVAPERFNNERFREAMRHLQVSLFAVDEAHCISEWGHNFRPDYLKLAEFAALCGVERRLALTATATPEVLDDICRQFAVDPGCSVRTGFYRPNLTVLVRAVAEPARDGELLRRLRERPGAPTIVYVTLQRTAEQLAARLEREGFPARPYHAGLGDERRAVTQEWFMSSERAVVVATIAFGMGIDKADIRYVYHYNLPKSLENFSQEIGRAGRDGAPSICETFACEADLDVLANFAYGDTPSLASIRALVHEVFSLGEHFDVAVHELSAEHDIRPLVVRTLLTYLELGGYLEGGTPFYSTYQFRPLVPIEAIVDRFEGERRQFLGAVLDVAVKARTWFRIDTDAAAAAVGSPRDRVVRALDYLGDQRLLEVRAAGVRHRYRRVAMPADLEALAGELDARSRAREAAEIERLGQVVDLASQDACLVAALARHFGESMDRDCGHCSWCLGRCHGSCHGDRGAPIRGRAAPAPIDPDVWREALALRDARPETAADPRLLARLLCGVSSPRLTRAKLTGHRLFGALQRVPFPDVLARCEAIAAAGACAGSSPSSGAGPAPV